MLEHCGEIQDEDGVDPREFFQTNRTHKKENRKAKQLCRQVAETLDQLLSGEMGDDILRGLRVIDVVPAPDASRLLVTLFADCDPTDFDQNRIELRLADCKGRLRCGIASAITRRKTPTLTFNIVGPSGYTNETAKGGNQ
jgi:ribosome-binding factor A